MMSSNTDQPDPEDVDTAGQRRLGQVNLLGDGVQRRAVELRDLRRQGGLADAQLLGGVPHLRRLDELLHAGPGLRLTGRDGRVQVGGRNRAPALRRERRADCESECCDERGESLRHADLLMMG